MRRKLLLWAGFFLSSLSAADDKGSVPVVDKFVNIFLDMANGTVGKFFIFLVILLSGVMAWRNGNLTPLFWGIAAAILIGGAGSIAGALQSTSQGMFGQ